MDILAKLPTLPVFPVEYRKTAPATGLPEILGLPDFSQADTSVQKRGLVSKLALKPKTVGKAKAMTVMTTSLRSVASDMVEPCVCECSLYQSRSATV